VVELRGVTSPLATASDSIVLQTNRIPKLPTQEEGAAVSKITKMHSATVESYLSICDAERSKNIL
jgi:hypothetical protein